MYTYKKFGNRYVLSLDNHQPIVEAFDGELTCYFDPSMGLNLYQMDREEAEKA